MSAASSKRGGLADRAAVLVESREKSLSQAVEGKIPGTTGSDI
jgi:hypothetical protein